MSNMKEKERVISAGENTAENSIDEAKKEGQAALNAGEKRESSAAGSEEKKEAEFEALISGEYKNQFAKKVRKILEKRLREVKKVKEAENKNMQLVELMLKKYGIEDGDTAKLEELLKNESPDKESERDAVIRNLTEQIALIKKSNLERERERASKERIEAWRKQAEETAKIYPEFNFEAELENPEFCRLLKVGVSVKNAYEVVNMDNLLERSAKEAEKSVVNSIRTNGARPIENGSDPTGGILLSSNVSALTKKERAELARRAAGGERITF